MEQAWQSFGSPPPQAVSQQTPSTHWPLPQSAPVAQGLPLVPSMTVTWNVPLASLLAASRATHATVVAPTRKRLPERGVHEIWTLPPCCGSPLTASVAYTMLSSKVTVAPPFASATTAGGAVRDRRGGVVSRTTTVKLPEPVLPAPSVALQLTTSSPSGSWVCPGPMVTGSPVFVTRRQIGVGLPLTRSKVETT